MKQIVSQCVEYLSPRYPALLQRYPLQDYPTPRALLGALAKQDHALIYSLSLARGEDSALCALTLCLAPALRRDYPFIERLGLSVFSLLWEALAAPLPREKPAAELESRLRALVKSQWVKQKRYQERFVPSEDLAPLRFENPEHRIELERLLQKIPQRSRLILVGSVLYGMTAKELGEWISMREEGARKAKLRLLGKVRHSYQAQSYASNSQINAH